MLEQDQKFTPTNINLWTWPKYGWIWPKLKYLWSYSHSNVHRRGTFIIFLVKFEGLCSLVWIFCSCSSISVIFIHSSWIGHVNISRSIQCRKLVLILITFKIELACRDNRTLFYSLFWKIVGHSLMPLQKFDENLYNQFFVYFVSNKQGWLYW